MTSPGRTTPDSETRTPGRGVLALGIEPRLLRACLIDRIGAEHRLVGWINVERSEHAPLTGQVAAVVRRLGLRLGRRLWDDGRQAPFTRSANAVTTPPLDVISAGIGAQPPLQVWAVGLTSRGSVAALETALAATDAEVVGATALSTTLRADQLAQDIGLVRPHVLLMAGGFERAEPSTQQQTLRLAAYVARALAALPPNRRPPVIFAGAGQSADAVQARFADTEPTLSFERVPNVHPEPGVIQRGELVQRLNEQQWRRLRQQPGIGRVGQWVTPPLQLTRLETTFAQMVQAWRDYHDLPELHGAFISGTRRVHVWTVRARPDMGLHYAPVAAALEPLRGWPPLRLLSGPWAGPPAGITWWDQSGLAPLVATVGHVAPEAMLQVLTQDVLRRVV